MHKVNLSALISGACGRVRALGGGLRAGVGALVMAGAFLAAPTAFGATRYVETDGDDAGNDCTAKADPCQTIEHGITQMAGGDTLIIGDGTYAESIVNMPSGTAGAYTTIRAANDWGVLIDGAGFDDEYMAGVNISSKSYVHVRGFRIQMNQAKQTNSAAVSIPYSDHIKIERCGGSYAPTDGNAATFGVGPASKYVLIEESYAFGGARYQFLVYQSDHVVVRRSVARNDHWTGSLQCAGFVNYDSLDTAWHNNIVLDSDTANCSRGLYGGFWNENKMDVTLATSQSLAGNIILNVNAFFGATDLDWAVSGERTITDMVIWGSSGGYVAEQMDGEDPATLSVNRMTVGALAGKYDRNNGAAGEGTGISVWDSISNTLTNSIFAGCESIGVADDTTSDYNAFFDNGANYAGNNKAAVGTNDLSSENDNELDPFKSGLRYLPRIEPDSPLKTAGKDGGQIGAEIIFRTGKAGTLHGEAGWNELTTERLWPFPNEDQIRADMASYTGPGAPGVRGFTEGNSLDGTPQTLTKYIWEYLGNEIPPDIYGLHITTEALPDGKLDATYSATLEASGGQAPYTWALEGSLPAGLKFAAATGVISGKPTKVGTVTFTVSVTDSADPMVTATKDLRIIVEEDAGGSGGSDGGTGGGAGGSGGSGDGGSGDGGSGDGGSGDGGSGGGDGGSGDGGTGDGGSGDGGDGGGNQKAAPPAEDSGCGCRAGGRFKGGGLALLATILAGLLARRRR